MAKPVERLRRDQLETLLRNAQPRLMRIATRLCATTDDARDLVQDVIERVMKTGIPADVRSPRAWLGAVLRHLFVDRCRVAARRPIHEHFDDEATACTQNADAPVWADVTSEDLLRAVRSLEPIYRRTYELHTFSELSYKEISRLEQITTTTVGTRLNRAREMIRELLLEQIRKGKP